MRTVLLLGSLLFLGMLVFVPATGTASGADLVATSGIPIKLFGNTDATAADGLLRFQEGAHDLSIRPGGAALEKVRVTSAYTRLVAADVSGERRVETTPLGQIPGEILVQPTSTELLVAAQGKLATVQTRQAYTAEPAANLWTEAGGSLSALIADEPVSPPIPATKLLELSSTTAPTLAVGRGAYAVTSTGSAAIERADTILVYGAKLVQRDGKVIGESTRSIAQKEGGVYVATPTGGSWAGPGTHVEEVVEYFVLRGPAAITGQGPLTLYAADVRLHHTGYIGFPWAKGALETTNESIALDGDQVVLGGDLWLRPIGFEARLAPQLTLLGNGNVHFVKIGVEGRSLANAEAAAVAGGTAAGLGALALLVYFWPSVKYAASLVLFPLYARVPKENTLDHKGRELLYDLIKNEPGISTNKLAKEVPFGWSTLTYHLRVLERNEAIVSVRDGRYKRFFDRQSGRFANGRKYILAVLKNDATFGIARYIRERPGSSQKEVANHFQLSPSSVHWHVERLSEVGLVSKAREAHNVRYKPGEAWDHVTVEDLKALDAAPPEPASQAPQQAQVASTAPAAANSNTV